MKYSIDDVPGTVRVRDELLLAQQCFSDWKQFRRHSGLFGARGTRLTARIVMDAHRIEKGLALKAPKEWFGKDVLPRLRRNLDRLPDSTEHHVEHARAMAYGALAAYFEYFDASGVPSPKWVTGDMRTALLSPSADVTRGGTKPRTVAELPGVDEFDHLIESRESVRHFADIDVPLADIEAAARIAATSPSVCNRQGSRIRVFARGPEADAILKYQNGNTGFGSDARYTLLITHDLETMVAPSERNQAFVDGGLYAMTLVYALHARGIGTCCLNWSATQSKDRGLRKEIGLPAHEVVIMMLAVGYPAEGTQVAVSSVRHDRYAVGMAAPATRPHSELGDRKP